MSELISFGGGVNSTAMAIMLVNEGWRGPIVFSDTGCEWPETYCFMDMFESEWLKPRGLEITRIGAEWRTEAREGSLVEYCEAHGMVPLAVGGGVFV
jgi:3'-phosphoadenosine 5'-phosphosulfate sulfotransferase (PAPS reductase)/FAD synthetase